MCVSCKEKKKKDNHVTCVMYMTWQNNWIDIMYLLWKKKPKCFAAETNALSSGDEAYIEDMD